MSADPSRAAFLQAMGIRYPFISGELPAEQEKEAQDRAEAAWQGWQAALLYVTTLPVSAETVKKAKCWDSLKQACFSAKQPKRFLGISLPLMETEKMAAELLETLINIEMRHT